ncbi:alpha amylase [Flavobacteriaceae bacterium TP-CH-4]|uniref:Alpha amylase n=1 Tax=Pelagihabitans pacificus TaxID=2696054 RepID=A0A967AR54_9FLAO|nr:amylosucrase [Pelagihabitans pacificus]NHF58859.1 alpha amylase [Pelagihabitans pacificus]
MNQASLHRLIASAYPDSTGTNDLDGLFKLRLSTNLTLIKDLFFSLYPEKNHTESFKELVSVLPELFKERPRSLQLQDLNRLKQGNWYQSEQLVGMQLYVDHFNGDLRGLENKLGYFEKLGVNFLHLMPITPRPNGENDGGYAVNSYHEVDERFGTKEDLLRLTQKMRDKNMLLMLDFVANHTSNEFPWAKKAMKGDSKYQRFYHIYNDRSIPDAFEQKLPEIFPRTAPGNFSYNAEMQKWVMTVFNQYQWDLNYSNPEVFIAMLDNLLKLANLGVDVVRLDALAFMWKKLGTQSQNLPEAHALISLFRLCLQVVAPGVVFLAEAIVAPDEIVKYFGSGPTKGNECEIAYNATLMALLWDAIATKKTILLYKNIGHLPKKPDEATWINYVRCHDDIGLGFKDEYIHEVGWDAKTHRKFLLDYYCQKIEWSPAKGYLFMYNPKNGDGRITGSCSSLLGLEKALEQDNKVKIEEAIHKIVMLHGIILSYGGIPLIYAGDEIGTLNDYSYLKDKDKKEDNRWVNRPYQDWKVIDNLDTKETYHSKIFFSLQKLIRLRKQLPVFADHNNFALYDGHNPHVLIFERTSEKDIGLLVVSNFDNSPQIIDHIRLGSFGKQAKPKDLISGRSVRFVNDTLKLKPYQLLWLVKT